ncbi:hypothetical protein SNEBB_007915 [Seison nebaliae]|nr:hypothetical protein SNEBB_007915 [Seison nebaliae]
MRNIRGDTMRGLSVFISDIRNCRSREAETRRILRELANIRSKFRGDRALDGYQKKKYVCKLIFIFLHGYDIDFGYNEAVNLLSSNKYSEKQIGYLFISILVSAENDLMRLIMQNIRNDLQSRNPIFVQLALQCIANMNDNPEIVEMVGQEIPKLLISGESIDSIKQSAALCLLKLVRLQPNLIDHDYAPRIIHLLNDQHIGVVTAATGLLVQLCKQFPEEYKGCVSLTVSRLSRIITTSYKDLQDYTYYFIPAPWLAVKLLQILQCYQPSEDAGIRSRLNECLDTLLKRVVDNPRTKKTQHSNAKNAVLFEAILLIIHLDNEPELLIRACNQLGVFLTSREVNLRYLALEYMCLLATSEFAHEAVKRHDETVCAALRTERDISVRQKAVDLLYAMCDQTNTEQIVEQMLSYLQASAADYSIREEMVLKVAILAEKYAINTNWYLDVMLRLIRLAGDFVSEEVWQRVIHIVTNRQEVQGYAAKTVFEALQAPACHENMVKVGGYILGEFGNYIAGDPRSSPEVLLQILHSKFPFCTLSTRYILLTAYVKFANLFPEMRSKILEILHLDMNIRSADIEMQQRVSEYHQLIKTSSDDELAYVFENMPSYPERESSILLKLKQKKQLTNVDHPSNGNVDKKNDVVSSSTAPFKNDLLTNKSNTLLEKAKVESITNNLSGLLIDDLNMNDSSQPSSNGNIIDSSINNKPLSNQPIQQQQQQQQPTASIPNNKIETNLNDIFGLGSTSTDVPSSIVSSSISPFVNNNEIDIPSNDNLKKAIMRHLEGFAITEDNCRIDITCETKKNFCKLQITFSNSVPSSFVMIDSSDINVPKLQLLQNNLSSFTEPKALIFTGQCSQVFRTIDNASSLPVIDFKFGEKTYHMTCPLFLNYFASDSPMEKSVFQQRWTYLASNGKMTSKIFEVSWTYEPSMNNIIDSKLIGMGFAIIGKSEPNQLEWNGGLIVNVSSQMKGVLHKLRYNQTTQMWQTEILSTQQDVADEIASLVVANISHN